MKCVKLECTHEAERGSNYCVECWHMRLGSPAAVIARTRKLAAILKMALPAAGYSASFESKINLLAQQLQRRGVRPPEDWISGPNGCSCPRCRRKRTP
jgi:hypothetical protein